MAGGYPAVTPSSEPGNPVVGELYLLHEPQRVLPQLDRYEGYDPADPRRSLYLRVEKKVTLAEPGTGIMSWIYIYNRPTANLTPIPSGDYLAYSNTGGSQS